MKLKYELCIPRNHAAIYIIGIQNIDIVRRFHALLKLFLIRQMMKRQHIQIKHWDSLLFEK